MDCRGRQYAYSQDRAVRLTRYTPAAHQLPERLGPADGSAKKHSASPPISSCSRHGSRRAPTMPRATQHSRCPAPHLLLGLGSSADGMTAGPLPRIIVRARPLMTLRWLNLAGTCLQRFSSPKLERRQAIGDDTNRERFDTHQDRLAMPGVTMFHHRRGWKGKPWHALRSSARLPPT